MAKGKSVNVGTLEAFLGLDDSAFYQGIKRAESTLASVGRKMQQVGKTMTTFVTLPLIGIGYGAIKAAMNFETAFARMQGLAGVTAEEINHLKQTVSALSVEMGRPPQELANALYFIRSSGFEGAGALDVLRNSAMAARAGLGETNVVADLLTSVINAYGHANINASDAVNTLTAAVRLGKGEPAQFAANLGYVVPIAAEMGVEFNEVAAAIAAMSRKMSATDLSTAVTNLRQVLSDLLSPAQHSRDALVAWGTSASELRKVIKDDGLLSALGFINSKMTENEEAFSDIFGNVRSLTGALSLAGVSAEGVAEVFEDMKDNTNELSRAVLVASNTTEDKFNRSMASLKVSAIELGNSLLPLFIDLVDVVKKAANWFTALSTESKQLVVVFGLLAAGMGPALTILGSVVSIFAAIGLAGLGVIAVIAGIAAAFIYVSENWEAIKERISDWTWWKNMLLDMMIALYEYNPFVLLAQMAIEQFNEMAGYFASVINNMIDKWNTLMIAMGKVPLMVKWITSEDLKMADPFDAAVKGLTALKGETKTYKNDFKSFTESIISFSGKAADAIRNLFPTGSGGGGSGAAVPALPVAGAANVKQFKPAEKAGVTWFGDGPIKETTKAVVELDTILKQVLTETVTELADAFADLFTGDSGATTFFQSLMGIVTNFMSSLGKALVAAAIAAIAFEDLLMNPYAALAAGFALMVAAGAVKNIMKQGVGGGGDSSTSNGAGGRRGGAIQGMATGGYVQQGGVFQLHKNELVNLPKGAAVTPAHMVGSTGGKQHVEIEGRISGYDLDLLSKKNSYKRGRLG